MQCSRCNRRSRCLARRLVWKKRLPTTPEEIYNEVFSDAHVDGYADPDLALDETQRAAGKEFVARMRDFDKIGGPELPWQEVIDHSGWVKVREAAKKFLTLLKPEA